MLLTLRNVLVKERVAVFRLVDTYDLFDPSTGLPVGIARDEPTPLEKWSRMLVKKSLLSTTVRVYEREGSPAVLTLRKKAGFLRHDVIVTDESGREIGRFRSKVVSLGGGFFVFDAQGGQFAEVKGDWKGWNFKFLAADGRELGLVTKKWAGVGKELFTNADNYLISVAETAGVRRDDSALLLAAGLAIDLVFKEKN